MCFAPQRRALFRHLNFKKCSGREVFLAFSLAHVLRATTACNFSSLIWPAGSAPAALASLLFDPPEPQIIGKKTQCFATFLPFRAPGSLSSETLSFVIFFLLRFSSLTLPISASHLSILSEVWLLNFLRYSHFPSTSDWLVWCPLFNQTQKSFVGSCWFYIPSIALLLITRSGSRLWIPIIHSLLDIPMISQ